MLSIGDGESIVNCNISDAAGLVISNEFNCTIPTSSGKNPTVGYFNFFGGEFESLQLKIVPRIEMPVRLTSVSGNSNAQGKSVTIFGDFGPAFATANVTFLPDSVSCTPVVRTQHLIHCTLSGQLPRTGALLATVTVSDDDCGQPATTSLTSVALILTDYSSNRFDFEFSNPKTFNALMFSNSNVGLEAHSIYVPVLSDNNTSLKAVSCSNATGVMGRIGQVWTNWQISVRLEISEKFQKLVSSSWTVRLVTNITACAGRSP